jgi:LysM repeat protein
VASAAPAQGELDEEEDEADADLGEGADEGEAQEEVASAPHGLGPLYTAELGDEELARRWEGDPASLGSMSVGFVEAGRLVNGVRFPKEDAWIVVSPEASYSTVETQQYLAEAIRAVRAQFPDAPPLRVNQLSSAEGGYLRPHKSHQNGRDVDLGFYYPTVDPIRVRERERYIDARLNWALVKALVTLTDVQLILVDKRVQRVLYEYALAQGEDRQWLDSLFHAGPRSIVKHARRHRDHFHVRFYNPRAQELGRRVAPLLAKRPEHNIASHRVRSGDTLSGIAHRFGSSVQAIRTANRMRNDFLRLGVVLRVPLRGPCTRCPLPPQVVVPPRRMPPDTQPPTLSASSEAGAGGSGYASGLR